MKFRKCFSFVLLSSVLIITCAPVNAQEVKKIKITELQKIIAESTTPLIVDFWATFCKPCVEEIPYFQQIINSNKKDSIQLLLVSLDLQAYYPAKIKDFAVKHKFTGKVSWLDESNADYFCPKIDTAWSGAIPASLFINNKTGYRQFFEQQLSKEKLQTEVMKLLGKID